MDDDDRRIENEMIIPDELIGSLSSERISDRNIEISDRSIEISDWRPSICDTNLRFSSRSSKFIDLSSSFSFESTRRKTEPYGT